MKRTLIAAAGFALLAATGLANAASWSVVVQPGVYGRVEIGGYVEAPRVYYDQPVMAVDNGDGEVVQEYVDTAYATAQPPVYLWVPEYQRTHWAQYCREYGAYGVPVYFVDDRWYRDNVMRRNWTQEQRSWNQVQWIEADRIARDRFERQRFERQRYEQQAREQQRWNNEGAWHDQRRDERDQRGRWEQAHRDHDRADRDGQDRMRWGSARGYVPQAPQPANSWQQPGQGWQGHGGQQSGGQQTGWQQGSHGYQGHVQPPPQAPQAQQPQWAARGNAHGAPVQAPIQNVVDRRDDNRGADQRQSRREGDGRGQFEHGRDGNRDR